MHDEPHTELERRALAAWTPDQPPPDFVERVMRAAARPQPVAPPIDLPTSARLRWPRIVAAAVAAVALAGGITAGIKLWTGERLSATHQRDQRDQRGQRVEEGPEPVSLTPAAAKAPTSEVPADLAAQVDRYMASFGEHHGDAFKFQGSVIVRRNGETLYSRHFGRADIAEDRPITGDTRFKIGSLTQQFTAVAILQLREQGQLRLDDPVRTHLPWYPQATVTIRHLLTHSSGIPNYTDSLGTAGVKPATRYAAQDIAAIFKDAPLEFKPGSEFDPSNSGYFLLGMIIEKLAGVPLGEYMQTHVFAAAGMDRSSLGGGQVRIGGVAMDADGKLATGYTFSEDELLVPVVGHDLSVYGGAAGMVSTPTDLSRWDSALRAPGTLLSPAALDEMFSPVVETYGLGWIIVKERGQTMVGHPGGVEGFNGAIARYLGDGITVIALANTEAIDCRDILDAVAAIAHGEPMPPFAEPVEVPVSPAMFSRFLGTFRLTPAARTSLATRVDREDLAMMEEVKIYDDNGRLFMLVPTHGAKWLHGLGEDRFFFKDLAGTIAQFGPPGAPVTSLRLWQDDLEFVLARVPAPTP